MKARYVPKLTREEEKRIKEVMREQFTVYAEQYAKDFEAVILWILHTYPEFRFGRKRLLRFRDYFIDYYTDMIRKYECGTVFPARIKLRDECGIDLDKMQRDEEDGGMEG